MIPATRHYEAVFKHDRDGTTPLYARETVAAWDDDGNPLIANGRRLVRADSFPNFEYVAEARGPVVAALPASGWKVTYRQDTGLQTVAVPLVGWLVYADGTVDPVALDANDDMDTVDPADGQLIPPAEPTP